MNQSKILINHINQAIEAEKTQLTASASLLLLCNNSFSCAGLELHRIGRYMCILRLRCTVLALPSPRCQLPVSSRETLSYANEVETVTGSICVILQNRHESFSHLFNFLLN